LKTPDSDLEKLPDAETPEAQDAENDPPSTSAEELGEMLPCIAKYVVNK